MRFALVILAVALCHVSAIPSPHDLVRSKSFLEKLTKGPQDFMIELTQQTQQVVDAVNTQHYANSAEKTTHMVAQLRSFTQKAQQPFVELFDDLAVEYRQYWITNRIFVKDGSLDLIRRLAKSHFVDSIDNIREPVVAHIDYTVDSRDSNPAALEWGVQNINAPAVWTDGFEGEGIVSSHIDTGVRHTHECFAGAMRDTHFWFDPYSGSANPIDENGHGTHTMGTIVGRGGTGVAPKSTFISCRGCDTSACTEDALLRCGQWTTCPTNADGTGEDCSLKPALSSNSWGGGQEDNWYDDVINAWRAANIVPIFALGNSGPGCRTANSPGDRHNVIGVGATNNLNNVASFSSHGPTLVTSRIKPDVSAPGNNVRSASHLDDVSYVALSGTSMATPHVAGAVAVLLSKDGSLTQDQLSTLLQDNNLRPRIENIVCTGGGVNITYPWPNNSYGWGKIDLKMASDAAN